MMIVKHYREMSKGVYRLCLPGGARPRSACVRDGILSITMDVDRREQAVSAAVHRETSGSFMRSIIGVSI